MHNPEHPVYIISKGRADSMITSKSLSRMKVPHYIIIEPQDEKLYEAALDNFNIRPWVTLIVAPFSNHGDGPGRARNYAWDHSISIGAEKPEVLHAESNAIAKLAKSTESGDGASMFITCSPCIECAKMIFQSGIKEVFYSEDYRDSRGIIFLNKCGITVKQI